MQWMIGSTHHIMHYFQIKTMLARYAALELFGGTEACREFHRKEIDKEFLISEEITLEAFVT